MINEVISWSMGMWVIFVVFEGEGEVRYIFIFVIRPKSLGKKCWI